MSAPLADLAAAYAALRSVLGALPEDDRDVAREALRDALDRDALALREPPGLVAGTFRVEGELRRGAAFRLLDLRHRDGGTRHVLKTIRPERANDPALRAMLRREAAHQLRLSHPALLPARALLRLAEGEPALLLDHVPGPSLAERLEAGPPPTRRECRDLAARMLAGLGAIHAAGLAHLDVSPANILLPGRDMAGALLADFGLSQPLGRPADTRIPGIERAGTPGFAAPEAGEPHRGLDERADLYGLGRVLLAALPEAAGALRRFAARLASPDPAGRPESAAAAVAELAGLASAPPDWTARRPGLRHSRNINGCFLQRVDDPGASLPGER